MWRFQTKKLHRPTDGPNVGCVPHICVFFCVKLGFVMLRVINNFGFFVQLVLFWRLLQVRPGPPKLSQRRIFGDFWCKIFTDQMPFHSPTSGVKAVTE